MKIKMAGFRVILFFALCAMWLIIDMISIFIAGWASLIPILFTPIFVLLAFNICNDLEFYYGRREKESPRDHFYRNHL